MPGPSLSRVQDAKHAHLNLFTSTEAMVRAMLLASVPMPCKYCSCVTLSLCLTLQGVRTALLRLLIHMVVANSALVSLCLRVLVLAMQPPSAPLKKDEEAAVALAAWQPAAGVVETQSEVIAALEKVPCTHQSCLQLCIWVCSFICALVLSPCC